MLQDIEVFTLLQLDAFAPEHPSCSVPKQWSRRGETHAPFVQLISPRGSLLALAMGNAVHGDVIVVGPNGWVELRPHLVVSERTKALAYHKKWWNGVRFFHRDGSVHEVERVEPASELSAQSRCCWL